MSINELKSMNERERITYFATAKTKDLKTILKSEGIKGYYKLRKAQALEMVLDMILEPETVEPEIVEPEIVAEPKKIIDIKIMNCDILDKTREYIDLNKIYNITKDYTKDHYRLDSFIDIVDNSYEITGCSKHYKAKGFNDCYFNPTQKLVINMSERFNNLLPEITLEGLSKRLNISTKELEDLCKPTTKIKIETLERLLKMYTIYDIITQK